MQKGQTYEIDSPFLKNDITTFELALKYGKVPDINSFTQKSTHQYVVYA